MTHASFAPWLIPPAVLGLAATAWLGHGPACTALILIGLALVACQIAWQDLATLTVSDLAVAALGLLALAARLREGHLDGLPPSAVLGPAGLDGLLCGGAFLLVREGFYRLRGYDGLGFGDVKLALVGGVLVGTEGFAWAVLAASLGGLAVAACLRDRASADRRRLPYGTLLAPTLWLVWLLTAFLPQAPAFVVGAS